MKLRLETVKITNVEFGPKTRISNGVLSVNKEELIGLLSDDENFASVDIELAKPGDPTRIVNVADVVEARCKISDGADFPGVLGKMVSAGRGTTRALKGMAVVLCDRHRHWIHSKALIDMSGPGAEVGRYGKMFNVVIDPIPKGEIGDTDYAYAVRQAGFKAAVYLAKAATAEQVDEVEVCDTESINPDLPNIAYYYQIYSPQHDPKGIPDPIFYGTPISLTLPLVVNPNEIIDGAVTSGYTIRMMETYSIQNHPIVTELLRRHGKDLNFVGVVLAVCSMEPVRRDLGGMMVGNLVHDALKADGVIMTKPLGGAPNIDMGVAASACEKLGVKTTLILQILNTQASLDSEVLFNDKALNAIINGGIIFERQELPALKTIFGGDAETQVFNDSCKQFAGQPIEVEKRFICGCLNQLGETRAVAVEY
ncbi:MAG: glycine/sarcosine/betaine reductase component B subunit [Desulfobaccales bacterium]